MIKLLNDSKMNQKIEIYFYPKWKSGTIFDSEDKTK